jgi:hypothetical protein
VIADLLERVRERCEVALVEVLHEVLVDAAVVHEARGVQRLDAVGGDEDQDDAPVGRRSLAPHEPGLLHAVDDTGQAALARQDPAGELVHRQPGFGVFEFDEHVVPAQRDAALGPQFGVEDVDQRERALQEEPQATNCSRVGLDIAVSLWDSSISDYSMCD